MTLSPTRRAVTLGLSRWAAGLAVLLAAPGWAKAAPAATTASFEQWLAGLRRDAMAEGIAASTLDMALAGVAPLPRVLELDAKQPEFTLTFAQYLDRVVPAQRIALAQRKLAEHRPLLQRIGGHYGVQPRFLVALWGLESDFGRLTGGFAIIPALATLAYDGRRSAFFRAELLHALHILDEERVPAGRLTGSWAGAMGQSQFMPSTFRRYAVDYDGDGHRDIWASQADVFASIANYLAGLRWQPGETWGRPVRLPAGFDPKLADGKIEKSLGAWQKLGLRTADGAALPQGRMAASVLLPAGRDGPAFLVYHNFKAILRWNRSTYFAAAVGRLADSLEGS